ncbi:BOS complex subunit TMEM147 [Hydra vulgaris]|uniref:BOS complex subunit TMEM147 n=1 Tax=Hydra vulgaris TaxID=6087 RepID=T2M6F7_HYDVU|nr:transmembrane protein 147 [Hydra vulgaris]
MTLFHFGNCVALSIGPHLLLYRSSGLSDYHTLWHLGKSVLAYIITQMCKMLILATFFPLNDNNSLQGDFLGEFMKSTIDLSDLLGLHLLMNRISGSGELKVLVSGLGWASSEFCMTKLLPLWFGARAIEFDWVHTRSSFDTNITLVLYLTIAALIWLRTRKDLQKIYIPVVFIMLILCCYRSYVLEIASHIFGLSSWSLLLFKAAYTCGLAVIALQMCVSLSKNTKTY